MFIAIDIESVLKLDSRQQQQHQTQSQTIDDAHWITNQLKRKMFMQDIEWDNKSSYTRTPKRLIKASNFKPLRFITTWMPSRFVFLFRSTHQPKICPATGARVLAVLNCRTPFWFAFYSDDFISNIEPCQFTWCAPNAPTFRSEFFQSNFYWHSMPGIKARNWKIIDLNGPN